MKRIYLNERQLYRLIERALLGDSLCDAYEQIVNVLSGIQEMAIRGTVETIGIDRTNMLKAQDILEKLCTEEGIDVTSLSSLGQSFKGLDNDGLFDAISDSLNSAWSALNDAIQNAEGYGAEDESGLVSDLYEALHIIEYVSQKWTSVTL